MNLQEIRRLVNHQYKKAISEMYEPPGALDLPPGEHREKAFERGNRQLTQAIDHMVEYTMENLSTWERADVEPELAKHYAEEHLDTVGFEDAYQALEDERLINAVSAEFPEDDYPLSIDEFYEELTQAMSEDDYDRDEF
jgi:hypothetical protein